MGVSLAASLTALVWTTPILQAAVEPATEGVPAPTAAAPFTLAQAADPQLTPYQGTPPPGYDGVMGAVRDWLARANRDYQGVVIRRLSQPADGAPDEIVRKIEETNSEAARASTTKQREDAAKKAAEVNERAAARKAQSDREAADAAAAKAAADRKAADEGARKATAEAAAEAERQRLANEREIEAQRAAEERRTSEAASRRLADEQRQTEARIAEERRRAAEAERLTPDAREDRRTIVLTTEPIGRVERSDRRWRAAWNDGGTPRRRFHRGAHVKRWAYRERSFAACRRAGRRIVPPGWYRVATGDSLWRISAKHYRSGRYYRRLVRANRTMIHHPRRIFPCQRIYVPR